MKIAIIGTGISGLGAAYIMHPHHDITVYEKNNYIGGHSRTIDVKTPAGSVPVDTGFIVFNHRNYPHLTALFEKAGVKTEKSDMSFGACVENGWLEYSSKGLFGQKINMMRPRFWKMCVDILRFNKKAPVYLRSAEPDISLGDYLDEIGAGEWFKRYYLQAMGAAIWSCSVETIRSFPARSFLKFFENHGLLTVNDHPQWYTVSGGSRHYIDLVTRNFADKIKTGCGVVKVGKDIKGRPVIYDETGQATTYDKVVFACHADQALSLINTPSPLHTNILGRFSYQENKVIVHSDTSFMPQRRNCWASWIYLSEQRADHSESVSLSYWMNNLQNLDPAHPVFVTLNPGRRPQESLIHDEHVFTHPVFDSESVAAQKDMSALQGADSHYFCGAYQRYGFHEDGLLSAVEMAAMMGIRAPWI